LAKLGKVKADICGYTGGGIDCWRLENAVLSRDLAMKSIDVNRRFKIARLDMSRSDDSAYGQHVQHGLYLPSAGSFALNVLKR
jgi:hypothetical protein